MIPPSRKSTPARLMNLMVCSIAVAFASAAEALAIKDIKVQSVLYSEISLSATVTYDGELGETVMFGATAVGDDSVRGTGFRPTPLSKGTSSITFTVSRPQGESLERLDSQHLQLMVYNRETSQEERVNYSIEWPDFKQHFGLGGASSPRRLSGIQSATLNERFDGGKGLVRSLVELGIEPSEIDLYAVDLPAQALTAVALVLPETTAPDDLGVLLGVLRDLHVVVSKIDFLAIEAKDFKHGHVKIVRPAIVSAPPVPATLLDAVAKGAPPAQIYAHYGIKPRSPEHLNSELLKKAIALNDLGSRAGGVEAEKVLKALMDADYRNPRIYEQLARAYSRIGGIEETVDKQRTALNLSLQRFPNNHWAHAYLVFLETEQGNFEAAFKQLALARKHAKEQNVWLTVWAGRLHQAVGDHASAAQALKPLLALKNLEPSDDRARYYGLVAYAETLQQLQSSEVAAVYSAIISAYPERAVCNKLDLARYLLMRELDTGRATQLLDHADTRTCRGGSQLRSLVALQEWQRAAGSQQALFRIALDYGDMTDLVLQAAQFKNAAELLKAMTGKGVAIDTSNRYGYSALHLAAQQANTVAVDSLVRAGASVDLKSGDGLTALMLAVTSSRVEPVRRLLDAGADRRLKSDYGFTAQELANSFDNQAVIDLLLERSEI